MSWAKKNKVKKKVGNQKVKNATKITVDGITFDSKLESFAYGKFKMFKIPFDFQFEVELMPSFRCVEDKAVRRMYMVVDFVIRKDGMTYFVDTKGWATPEAKIKYKLLKYLIYRSGQNAIAIFLKNQGEVDKFINKLYDE